MTIKDDEFFDLETPSGAMRTHVFRPVAPGRYPGIAMYSEIFQLTPSMRRTAAILAGNGFVVAAPEIYHEYEAPGTVIGYDEASSARGNAWKTTKPLANFDNDIRAVLDFLKSHPNSTGKLGAIGFCIGGHLAVRSAFHPDVLATTCFYATDIHKRGLGEGANDDTLDRLKEIKGEMLFNWGRQDPHISREGRRLIYDALTDANVLFQWHEFNAEHAFLRDEGRRYNPALAQIGYALTLELFKRKLSEGDLAE